jgi:signal transduction histidine kinase
MRLVVILLLLVVLPTAILSLIAGRSIQAREVILSRRLEQNAIRRINRVGGTVESLVNLDLELIGSSFTETVLSGMDSESMEQRVIDLRGKCSFVEDVYLFMNPWNFIYPQVCEQDLDGGVSDTVLLQQELVKQISVGLRNRKSKVCFQYDNGTYCFMPMSGLLGLYAGFVIDMPNAAKRIEKIISKESSGDIEIRIAAMHGNPVSGISESVLVSDSFSPQPTAVSQFSVRTVSENGVLAVRRLPAPFSYIEIAAYMIREDDIHAAKVLEGHLIVWGIFLLAVVITASSAILILMTLNQAAAAGRRSEFVVGMSHDLRTPVASMRILAESLCAGRVESEEKQKEFVCTIAGECERLGDMIERILFFFRQDQGAMSYTMSLFDAGLMVERTVHSVEKRLFGKISVDLDVDREGANVVGDSDALAKVITNLLDNAVKYGGDAVSSSDGRICSCSVRVFTKRRRMRDWVVISVGDKGKGIAACEHKKIFRRFYRVDRAEHRHVGGIGLGLFLCADIVRAHHGRITVESMPGEGAVFSVWLRAG